jgi:hypothetical protein
MSTSATGEDLLLTALLVLDEGDESMSLAAIVRGIERRRGALSEDERTGLESLLRREGGVYLQAPQQPDDGWSITPDGQIYVRRQTVEPEDLSAMPPTSVPAEPEGVPFNPALIKVDPEQMYVYHALKLIKEGRLKLDPEFQRNFIWNPTQQSRLIESILLRIPLPAFYLDATQKNIYVVIDGLQRLTTLHRFCNQEEFALKDLQYLNEFNDRRFSQLPLDMQIRITEDTKLTVHTIRPETPPQVKFMIFRRVNTGGLVLTNQEIRHALYQGADGRAPRLLKELAESVAFREATDYSVSPKRMDDRECVLRFIAFYQSPYEQFGERRSVGEPANLDGLLNRTMEALNTLPLTTHAELAQVFTESMTKARLVFGRYAFRKLYGREFRRQPVSKPLFEVWSVLFTRYTQEELEKYREAIVDAFIEVMNTDTDFVNAISYGTGSPITVRTRFNRVLRLLQEVIA